MTSTGGTQQLSVPQTQNSAYSCTHCGLLFESSTSLQVHMHYQHENQSRWGGSPNTIISTSAPSSTTPTDTETNNNQPIGKHHIKAMSPHQNTIAAADSSDGHNNNNPPTPQPPHDAGTPHSYQSGGPNSPFVPSIPPPSNDIHHTSYPTTATYPPYEGLYYHNLDYGQSVHHQQEYKQTVPSSRYQPYNNSQTSNSQVPTTNSSVQINNNGLSPRVVSSTSPTHTSASPSQNSNSLLHIPPGQPTPSPSPKQCDKCGVVCETDGQLIEHSQVAHSDGHIVNGNGIGHNIKQENIEHNYPPFGHHHHHYNVKEEPSSDILDLDSQKMVYPPHPDGTLPPMHSLHPLQSMQRHPMIWGHDPHFIPPHPGVYHQNVKPEYPPTPPINTASHMKAPIDGYSPILPPTPVSMKQEYIKSSEYNSGNGVNQSNSLPPASTISKNFSPELADTGNQLTTSPSDFPSTTTPQENGGQFQRNFEPPSSSLPVTKSTGWKSNEARRPKTYNCTACNKWFTSSGHLKRHYNTTLHKNAVKSSGQPDPATLPISAHHHPNRDPNYMGKRRSHHQRNQQQQQAQQAQQQAQQQTQNQANNQVTTSANQQTTLQQQTIPAENSTRSPDYQPQFTLPSFGSSALQQGFQQYSGSSNIHNASGNGQAGPSLQVASQLRGLQLLSNSNLSMDHHQAHHHLQQELQLMEHTSTIISSTQPQSTIMQSPVTNSINNLTDQQQYQHLDTNTNIPSGYPITITTEELNYHNTIGNLRDSQLTDDELNDEQQQFTIIQPLPSIHPHPGHYMTTFDQIASRYTGGVPYPGDMPQPFSPDTPDPYQQMVISTTAGTSMPYEDDMIPQCAMAPSSPSISSTGHIQMSTLSNISSMDKTKVSRKSSNLTVASTTTSSISEFRCDICDKVFNKSCYLTQHNKTFHVGEKPFKCHRCGKRFPCDASHEEHVAKHDGDKPFKCVQCPKAFNHKTDLRRHMCLHSGSKPYTCELCGKGFIRKDHMVKHTETHTKKKGNGSKKPKNGKKRLSSLSLQPDSNDSMHASD
ncbi:transcription factor Zelda [Chironomus tepperi]|uniref:transcription factor Zelda n=1 Tax=Chironomus tepperi TaxID=113505 RepID=UPI00391F9EDB